MRHNQFAVVLLLLVGWVSASCAQEADVEKLIEKADPAIQAQIQRILDVFQKPGIDPHDVEVCRQLHALKMLSAGQDELVKQLAIFVATKSPPETQKGPEETHVLILNEMLRLLDIPPIIAIRVLAPYLDTDNRQLRDSVRLWFHFHDGAQSAPAGSPPIKPVNYNDYVAYVHWKLIHKEDVPVAFARYIYEQSPGRALLVFAYAIQDVDLTRRQARMEARRELEQAEHIVSNAIWLKENEFAERFQAALPEANKELAKLAKHDEWWARLYVAYVMRQHPELRQADVLQQLRGDSNPLVSEAAGPEVAQQKP